MTTPAPADREALARALADALAADSMSARYDAPYVSRYEDVGPDAGTLIVDGRVDLGAIAVYILARWRLAPRFKCAYKSAHEHADGNATCCGLPVIPWGEESVR